MSTVLEYVDFKRPLPSRTHKYLFVAMDEFSNFPFAIPCKDNSLKTTILCLELIFFLCGEPNYLYSDWGLGSLTHEVKEYLLFYRVALNKITLYQSQGNTPVAHNNGIIWKTIFLILKSQNLPLTHWELVLPHALHSIRSILSTVTNNTQEMLHIFPKVINRHVFPLLAAKTQTSLFKPVFKILKEWSFSWGSGSTGQNLRYGDGHKSTMLLP